MTLLCFIFLLSNIFTLIPRNFYLMNYSQVFVKCFFFSSRVFTGEQSANRAAVTESVSLGFLWLEKQDSGDCFLYLILVDVIINVSTFSIFPPVKISPNTGSKSFQGLWMRWKNVVIQFIFILFSQPTIILLIHFHNCRLNSRYSWQESYRLI